MNDNRNETDSAPPLGRLETLTLVAVVGVLAAALGLAALVMPSATTETQKAGYTQSAEFSYSATAPASSVYGEAGLSSGEPILGKVVGKVTADFTYRLEAKRPTEVSGTARMNAVVELAQGFTRTFVVAPRTSFTGGEVSLFGELPVREITRYVDDANASLGSTLSSATITLRPQVKVAGTVDAHPFKASYAPRLPFTLEGSTLSPSNAGSVAEEAVTDPLKPSKKGSVDYREQVTNTMPIPVVHPTVPTARMVGLGVGGLCLLLGLWLARPLLRRDRTAGETERIRAMYGTQLVRLNDLALPDGPVAEVATIAALADLAKRYESMIMHVSRDDDGDSYLVWDNGLLYRYRPKGSPTPEKPREKPQSNSTPPPSAAAASKPLARNGKSLNGHQEPARGRKS